MFNDTQKLKIMEVKSRLVAHVESMTNQPWFDPGLAIDWRKVYLSGGAIASLLQGQEPKDWDFYFADEQTMNWVRDMLLAHGEHIADVKEGYQEVLGKDGKMITSNAITMKDGSSFITRLWGEPKYMKLSFDYLHCTPHYEIVDEKLYISPAQYSAAVNKVLIQNSREKPKQWRTDKFKQRGYT